MKKLTQRQKEVLDTLKALIADKGYPPTVKELGKALGISDKATHDYLNVLKKKKKITWKSNEGRRSPRGHQNTARPVSCETRHPQSRYQKR